MEKTKVIFKKEYNQYTKQWEIIALFPEFEASFGKIQCYTEEGWNECDINYYRHNTKKATPEEYGKMYEYLKDIFEVNTNGDTPLQLEIVQKISTKMYDKLLNMWRIS